MMNHKKISTRQTLCNVCLTTRSGAVDCAVRSRRVVGGERCVSVGATNVDRCSG